MNTSFTAFTLPLTAGWPQSPGPTLDYTWLSIACLIGWVIYNAIKPKSSYDAIPAIGRTGILSYIDAIYGVKHTEQALQEGYNKYHPGVFRIPQLNRWHVIVSGDKLVDELRNVPDDIFSISEAARDDFATEYTFGSNVIEDPYHISVFRNQLTRSLSSVFNNVREEIVVAFDEKIPPTEDWTSVKALDTMLKITSQTTNRLIEKGPPGHDPEYIELNVQFTLDVVIASNIISLFPNFLKPLAGRYLTGVSRSIGVALKHLRPIIEERLQKINEYGSDYPDKPVDMLSWLIDEATDKERTVENLTRRILSINFAAVHTTANSFTNALFELASRPEYVKPLREEVEAVIAEDGWSKVAMTRMRKLDSFLKESQRLRVLSALSMTREVLKDFTFSDGTRIPKGARVSTASLAHHMDEEVYPDATTFNGFRFSDIREEDGEGTKNQLVATGLKFLSFGHGRHACPGRFFAANELKTMLAHVILTYDIKMASPGTFRRIWFNHNVLPDPMAEVMFRRRQL